MALATNITLYLEPLVEELYAKTILLLYMIYTNQTGKFPIRSKSGNNYIIVLCDYNANAILGIPILDRKSTTLQKAFLSLFYEIKQKSYAPTIIRLDNKALNSYLNLLKNLSLKI